ncbi:MULTISPECIES: DUF5683 domain-containing protein [Capnocytophaga]|uniref:DUF5683 domain-containing protein n=1 Tax=Capnocytophaga canis TaxID=1848903 RepID=A0A0B7IRC5_9FLAO|nr:MULTISPECIES: DUF5683 domain-containing protein [Capnocytophaga]ATA73501.1 hypothetical protein CGC49_09565 [Capnocytophaga sp. H4358]ATA75639.1 hypothetical protein CGC52_09540 [Capnocytophaga sp. H2931]RIY37972.1 hypothetical protein CKY20_00015 [Capnocytophaga canis]CEN43582.1 conserved exported hypothetical protein [Capnocytophaga canis]CEN46940.1 conserved exported hypothetical protein [Capnocytophaga canis]
MNRFFLILLFLGGYVAKAQQTNLSDTLKISTVEDKKEVRQVTWNTDPLSPARAAFYAAILPGLGQAYNKSYWKMPIVYVAIGTPIYFYIANTREFNRYQAAYKRRAAGFTDDEFYGNRPDGQPRLSTDGLRRAQQFYRRNQELSLLITIGLYALNIVDANVDAHLKQFNVDEKLSFEPFIEINEFTAQPQFGLSVQVRF